MTISIPGLRIGSMALLLLSPGIALADEAGPAPQGSPPAPGAAANVTPPTPQQRAAREAGRLQLEHLRQQARAQMLADLTPQHRTQFAAIVGELAVSPAPDPRAAARQIDALLTAREGRAVIATATSEREAARALMQSARTQMEASLTPAERERMQARMQRMEAMRASRPAPPADPGMFLLHGALGLGGEHRGPHGDGMHGDGPRGDGPPAP